MALNLKDVLTQRAVTIDEPLELRDELTAALPNLDLLVIQLIHDNETSGTSRNASLAQRALLDRVTRHTKAVHLTLLVTNLDTMSGKSGNVFDAVEHELNTSNIAVVLQLEPLTGTTTVILICLFISNTSHF